MFEMKQENEKVSLNVVDMDFLESMGMAPSPVASRPSLPSEKKIKKEQKEPEKMTSSPDEILSKLNDKNNQFISAYNSYAIGNRES